MNEPTIPFPSRGPSCPAPALLEALSAGEDQQGTGAHAAGCESCRGYINALRAESDAFLKMRPPERFLKQLDARAQAQADQKKSRFSLWSLFAAPAAALAVVLAVFAPRGPSNPDVLLKGGGLKVSMLRGGGTPEIVQPDARLRAGDALRFSYEAKSAGYLLVLDLDGTGKASVFHPFNGARSEKLSPSSREFFGGVVLDAAPGPEWIVAVWSPEPLEAAPLLKQLEARGPSETPTLSCGRCEVSPLRIQKKP